MGRGLRSVRIERIRISKNQLNPFDPRPRAILYLPKTLLGNKSNVQIIITKEDGQQVFYATWMLQIEPERFIFVPDILLSVAMR
jgi:hypothetical protein